MGYVAVTEIHEDLVSKYNPDKYHILGFIFVDHETKAISMLPGVDEQFNEWMNGETPIQ